MLDSSMGLYQIIRIYTHSKIEKMLYNLLMAFQTGFEYSWY